MRILTTIAVAFAMSTASASDMPNPAPSGTYISDASHTSVTWRIGHFGLSNYTARFTGVEAKLKWDRDNPEKSTLKVEIDPRSVRTDFPFPEKEDFDHKIGQTKDFLADQAISFVSDKIVATGDNTGQVVGQLTLRGKTRPATLDVVFNGSIAEHPIEKMPKLGFSASTTIKRSDWGLIFAPSALSNDVEVSVEAEFMPPS